MTDFKEYSELFHAGTVKRAGELINRARRAKEESTPSEDTVLWRKCWNEITPRGKNLSGHWLGLFNSMLNKYGNPAKWDREYSHIFKFSGGDKSIVSNIYDQYKKAKDKPFRITGESLVQWPNRTESRRK